MKPSAGEFTGGSITAPYFHRTWETSDIDRLHDTGFTSVIFCLREEHLDGYQPHHDMKKVVAHARNSGLRTEVDLWGFGNVFGGEARSSFGPENPACYDSPSFHKLMRKGVAFAAHLQPDGMFWDEAHFKDCNHCDGANESALLEQYAKRAHKKYGLENAICLTSSAKNMGRLAMLAAKPYVHQVETDPYYTNYPGIHDSVDRYVGEYSRTLHSIAFEHQTSARLWVQGFGLQEGWEDIPSRAAESAIRNGVRNIGFWACHDWQRSDIDFGYPGIVPVNNAAVIDQVPKIRKSLFDEQNTVSRN